MSAKDAGISTDNALTNGGGENGSSSSSHSNKPSSPSKLNKLKYSGYSAEFLDRVEPNGNIPHKNIAGRNEEKAFYEYI